MPIVDHPSFQPAPTPQTPLWRYLSFPKFMSLLQKRSLFFCNLEVLAQSDPFEGTLPASHFWHRNIPPADEMPQQVRDLWLGMLSLHGQTDVDEANRQVSDYNEYWSRYAFAVRRMYFVNCWHISSYESSAMWDVYSRRDEGIAIVSSEERCRAALSDCNLDVYGGRVRYEDYAGPDALDIMDYETQLFELILSKRNSFEYEQEYRLVWHDVSRLWKRVGPFAGYLKVGGLSLPAPKRLTVRLEPEEITDIPISPGLNIACDLEKLVEKVYVSPLAPSWFHETVQDAVAKYELNVEVKKSELGSEPLR